MKKLRLFCLVCAVLRLSGCDSSPIVSRYELRLPEIPPAWEAFPGPPAWKIEWLDTQGRLQTLEIRGGESPEISLPHTWTSAVIAWPYWPELPLNPGVFRPAGGLFPFDVRGATLSLSWRGGVDAVFYRELGAAAAEAPEQQSGVPRLPWHFDWPRFRELYDDPGVSAEFRADPWLADWSGIALRVRQSGFDKRRLVPQTRQALRVTVAPGPWIGTSPFAAPLYFDDGATFPVRVPETVPNTGSFPVDTWISAEGIVRCNAQTYIFLSWESAGR